MSHTVRFMPGVAVLKYICQEDQGSEASDTTVSDRLPFDSHLEAAQRVAVDEPGEGRAPEQEKEHVLEQEQEQVVSTWRRKLLPIYEAEKHEIEKVSECSARSGSAHSDGVQTSQRGEVDQIEKGHRQDELRNAELPCLPPAVARLLQVTDGLWEEDNPQEPSALRGSEASDGSAASAGGACLPWEVHAQKMHPMLRKALIKLQGAGVAGGVAATHLPPLSL